MLAVPGATLLLASLIVTCYELLAVNHSLDQLYIYVDLLVEIMLQLLPQPLQEVQGTEVLSVCRFV
jgi:hypothetical protein